MIEKFTQVILKELLAIDSSPCLSLYMTAHRSHPENLQDPIRFKNLVKQMEKSLSIKYSDSEVREYLEPFETLAKNTDFWNHTTAGLAVLSAKGVFKTIGVLIPIEELAIVADSFHTKPLRKYLQSADRYNLLGLSLHDIKLYEGDRHTLFELELHDNISDTITEALGGDRLKEKHSTVASYGGTGGKSSGMHHGHGGYKEVADKDTERFFRSVASEIYEEYSKPTGWPLILAALPEHHNLFQKVNKNPFLISNGINLNPTTLTTDKLLDMVWEIMEPEYLKKLESLAEKFGQARADGKGSDDYKEVALAAVEGRVDTLIVEADRIIPVRITNLVTGNTQNKDIQNPKVDDLLDDMGELVTKMGGQVMVFPAEKMPSETGLAAIIRY